jgi:hypothetical protein
VADVTAGSLILLDGAAAVVKKTVALGTQPAADAARSSVRAPAGRRNALPHGVRQRRDFIGLRPERRPPPTQRSRRVKIQLKSAKCKVQSAGERGYLQTGRSETGGDFNPRRADARNPIGTI